MNSLVFCIDDFVIFQNSIPLLFMFDIMKTLRTGTLNSNDSIDLSFLNLKRRLSDASKKYGPCFTKAWRTHIDRKWRYLSSKTYCRYNMKYAQRTLSIVYFYPAVIFLKLLTKIGQENFKEWIDSFGSPHKNRRVFRPLK